jgi:hypothetical protein
MITGLRALAAVALIGVPLWLAWAGMTGWWLLASAALINGVSAATDPRSAVALKRAGWENVLIIWATTLPVVLVIQAAVWLTASLVV